jgi:hypothetical protein
VADYDAWVKSRILPRARKEVRLPEALYVNRLPTSASTSRRTS